MGRNKKVVEIDRAKLESMTRFEEFTQLFHHELSKIPYSEITNDTKEKAESVAADYYRKRGFEVHKSRVKNGYRCVGVEFYWKDYKDILSAADKELICRLKGVMSNGDFEEFAMMVEQKNGTPDLLLIKNERIEFVEVKYNYETVKPSTVEFYLRYGDKWPISILRVICKA
jgi:Holliday junction resolvase-like predicted endonuclease